MFNAVEGNTTFYAEYGRVNDGLTGLVADAGVSAFSGLGLLGANGVVVDSDMTWWGLGVVQTIDAAAMDLYLGYRRYSGSVDLGNSGAQGIGGAIQVPGVYPMLLCQLSPTVQPGIGHCSTRYSMPRALASLSSGTNTCSKNPRF